MASDTTDKPQIRAGCYCRISSDPDDKREGVDRQREDTSALCEIKGWQVGGYYVDNDRSASNGGERPEWERLLADVEAGKIDAIAAWDQDRGWRMMHELEALRKFFAGLGRRIPLATTGQGDIDLNSPAGVMMAQVKTAVSEHEVAMMKVRIRRAARQKAEQGRPAWKVAFGYLPELRRREADDGTRQIDPVTAPLVRKAYSAVLAGASLKDIAAMWNDAGAYTVKGGEWDISGVSNFLRHPRNAGLRTHFITGQSRRGYLEIVGPGTWPALVEKSVWRSAQTVLAGRPSGGRGGRRSVRKHTLTGVLRCGRQGCDGHLGGTRTTSGDVSYTCPVCYKVGVRASCVEPLLVELIGRRLAQPDAVDLLKSEIHDAGEAQELREEKAALYSRLDEFALERAQGLMTGRQLQIASEAVQGQIDALDRKEQDQERLRVFDAIPLGTDDVREAVAALSPDRFRAVLSVLCTVTVKPVGKVGHVFNPDRISVEWL